MIVKDFKKALKKILLMKINKDILYPIGDYTIWLPSSHTLPGYQKKYKNYDKKLKNIILNIEKESGNGLILDIGANVGDTAAYLRSFSSSEIYCVEGDLIFLNYLYKNARIIPNIHIIDSFVSGINKDFRYKVQRTEGTASLILSEERKSFLKMISLAEIVSQAKTVEGKINLIKIDTDGFDFDILLENKDIIDKFKPSIYLEYDIGFKETGVNDSLAVILFLEKLGYSFIVYDNFGNLLDFIFNNCHKRFQFLNHYLQSNLRFGGGIYYFDIFASVNKTMMKNIVDEDFLQ